MTPILALVISAVTTLTPIRVHVDGDGYMRFIRDGRVVYAKQATLTNVHGQLGADGAEILPAISVSDSVSNISIDLMGNVRAGSAHLGRLVLGTFPAGSTSTGIGSFLGFTDRAVLTNPGEDTAGVIRVDGAARTEPKVEDPKPTVNPEIAAKAATPVTTTTTSSPHPRAITTNPATNTTGAQIQILVRQHTDVVGKNFSLGDIATITGPDELATAYKKVSIGATAIAGVNRIIDQKYVALKLMGAGFHAGSYVLIVPEGADVARKTVTVSAEDIVAKAIKAAQDKTGMNVPFKSTDTILPVIAEDGEVSIEASDATLVNKNYRVVVTVRQGTLIVGTRTINLSPPSELGSIKIGDSVTVLMRSGSAVIEVTGKALTQGFVGQKIQVSIAAIGASATTQTGTVIETGKVEVDL